MRTQKIFACLLAAVLALTVGAHMLFAQDLQSAGAPTGQPATASPALPVNPWGQLTPMTSQTAGTTGGAQAAGIASGTSTSQDPCSPVKPDPRSILFTPDPLGSAPGGSPDQLVTPPLELKPTNPVMKVCEGGRIIIRVQNKRYHSYHIGDEVPIEIKILADDGVRLDFSSLTQKMLGFEGSDFQLIPVRVVDIASRPYDKRPHSTLYGIELAVQTFVTRPVVAFNLDLRYAIDVPPDVKQPNWRVLTTPDFAITNSPLIVGNDDELAEGDLQPVDVRLPWAAWPLTVLGLFIAVWFGFLRRLVIHFNRKRPGRIIPPNEKAWAIFSKVYQDAKEYGEFSGQFLRKIDAGLRRYLAETTKLRIESFSIEELSALMADDPQLPLLVSVLQKCESVLFARADEDVQLTEDQIHELYEELKQLVPQPEEDE